MLKTVIDTTQEPDARKLLIRPTVGGRYALATSDKCCKACKQCAHCSRCPAPEINVDYTISYGGISVSTLDSLFFVKESEFAPVTVPPYRMLTLESTIDRMRFWASASLRCYGQVYANTYARPIVGKYVVRVHCRTDVRYTVRGQTFYAGYTGSPAAPYHSAYFEYFFSACNQPNFCKATQVELFCPWDYETEFTTDPMLLQWWEQNNTLQCWPSAPGWHVVKSTYSESKPQEVNDFLAAQAIQELKGFGLPIITMIDNPLP